LKQKVVLVGASTGGPSLIKKLICQIENLSSIIIINQHMKEEVLPFFIKDIQSSCKFNVQTTPLSFSMNRPSIIICSQSSIVEKKGTEFFIQTEIARQQYTPDINQFFNSFAKYVDSFETEVVMMTGIGRDGVLGAAKLKKLGAKIYAQDKKSSPVYGMPKAAFEEGIVDEVLSLDSLESYFRRL